MEGGYYSEGDVVLSECMYVCVSSDV